MRVNYYVFSKGHAKILNMDRAYERLARFTEPARRACELRSPARAQLVRTTSRAEPEPSPTEPEPSLEPRAKIPPLVGA